MFDLTGRLNLVLGNRSQLNGAIQDIDRSLNRGAKSARTFSDALSLKAVSFASYTAATIAVVKLTESIAKATNDALRFEVELAKIAQTFNKSNADIAKYANSIRKISVEYGLSAPKIAETIRVLGQAGFSFDQAREAADNLAKTTLLASFESIADTTDGLIAIQKQFTSTIGQSEKVLSLLNTTAKKYAVESSDLVETVRKAGGVFSATGGTLEELVAIFTTVRDTTRESAETIATGLRTIFSRIQRPKSIEFFKEIGIELTNLKGDYIGNYNAIREIQDGLARQNIRPGSIAFAQVVEELGGLRQASRVIPLLVQGAKLSKIYGETQQSTTEFTDDLSKAQETLAFKLAQTQQNFSKLIGDITETSTFKALTNAALGLANAVIKVADAFRDVIPLAAAVGTISLGRSLVKVAGQGLISPSRSRSLRRARGGPVPGIGNTDSVPALLTPGEFVINKSAAQAFGYENLHRVNKYADGGVVGPQVGYEDKYSSTPLKEKKLLDAAFKSLVSSLGTAGKEISNAIKSITLVPSITGPQGQDIKGRHYNSNKSILVSKKSGTDFTLKHEFGHAADYKLGGGENAASMKTGTFQNILASLVSKPTEKALKARYDRTYREGSPKQINDLNEHINTYRLNPKELFANTFASVPPIVQKMILSTTDATKGFALLAKYVNQFPAQKLYADLQDKILAYSKSLDTIQQIRSAGPAIRTSGSRKFVPSAADMFDDSRPYKEEGSPLDRFPQEKNQTVTYYSGEQARLRAEAKANVERANRNIRQIPNKNIRPVDVTEGSLARTADDIANERRKEAGRRRQTRNRSNDTIATIRRQQSEARARRVENAAVAADPASYLTRLNQGPVNWDFPDSRMSDEFEARYATSERRAVNHSRSFLGGTLSGGGIVDRVRSGQLPRDKKTRDRILANEASVPPEDRAQRAEEIRVARARKRSGGIIKTIRNQGGFDRNKPLPTTGLDASFGATAAAAASLTKQFIDQESAGGRFTAKLLDIATVAGILQSALASLGVTIKTDTIKKLLDIPKPNFGKLGKFANAEIPFTPTKDKIKELGSKAVGPLARAGFAAAGTFAFSSSIDAISGRSAQRDAAIKEGDISTASSSAVAAAFDSDVTNFATGLAGATSAIVEMVPVLGKFAPLIGLAVGGLTKLTSKLPLVGDGISVVAGLLRNSDLGILDSNALISARAGSEAARNRVEDVNKREANSFSSQLSKLGSGKLTGDDFFKSGTFKSISGATLSQAKQDSDLQKALKSDIGNSTSTTNAVVKTLSFGFIGQSTEELSKELDDARNRIKESSAETVQKIDPFIQDSLKRFVGSGGNDFDKFMSSLGDGASELIKLSDTSAKYKSDLEILVATEVSRKKAVQESIRLFETEYQLTKNRLAIQQKLDVAFSQVIASANKMNAAFSLVESSANIGGTLSIDNSASGQLSNLSNITDKKQFNKVLGSVGNLPGAEEVFKGAQFGEAIRAPGGLLQSALTGQISTEEASQRLQDPLTTSDQRKSIIDGQVANLAKTLAQFGVEAGVQTKIIGDFSKLVDDKNGQVDPEDVKDLLENALVKPAQETADKLAKVYDIQIDALNKFGDALRIVSDAEAKVREKRLQSTDSLFSFSNQLRELQTGKKTTAATLQDQSIARQQQILGADAGLAGDTTGIAAEVISLQKAIAESNKSIQEDPRGKEGEILVREQNIQRMERLNQALDEQVTAYDDIKSALLAVAEAEKTKATQIKDELLARTNQTREEQISQVRAESLADAFIAGDSRFDPRQLTSLATKNLNPEAAAQVRQQQALIKAEIDKVASQEGPRQQQAKDLQKQIALAEIDSQTFDKENLGLRSPTPAQRAAINRERDRLAKEEAKATKLLESNRELEDKKLKKTNPEEFARRQAIRKEAEDSKFAIRNEQTKRGAIAERQAVGVQGAEVRALGEQGAILQEQVALIKTSMEPFVQAVQNLVAMPKEIDVQVNDMAVSINHNGLEIFNQISSEIEKMILRGVVDNLKQYDLNKAAGAPALQNVGQSKIKKKL